jgi:para-nitrobenzyl esterase
MIRAFLAFVALVICATRVSAAGDPVVHLDAGAIRGLGGWSTQSFLGIPFAAPPIGALRWMPPRKVTPWTGVRDATHLAQPCATTGWGDGVRTTNEDCLYLNVYKPSSAKPGGALPVMVFIHGGGDVSGSTTIYDGVRMAEVGHAVVVIAAYRLGVFGSLALANAGKSGGTFIMQDNLAALHWVQRNVGAFGGNPHDVTVSGESSGGTSVCDVLASPAGAGLFRQAIVQSGLCHASFFEAPALATVQASTLALAAAVGCTGADVAVCLRAKPAGDLIDAWKAPSGNAFGTTLLPLSTGAAFARGAFNRVPVLIGFNRDEWWGFEHGLVPLSADGLQKQFVENFHDRASAVSTLYPEASYPHREYALGAAVGDSLIVCSSVAIARSLAAFVPVSMYEFADRTVPQFKSLNPAEPQPRPAGYLGGAGHTAELEYLYAYQSVDGPLNATQRRLGDAMIARWVGFNRAKPSPWPAFTPKRPTIERIGADGSSFAASASVVDEHHCGFWNSP